MVIFSNPSDERAFLAADYRLVRIDDGRVLMTRRLRAIDAQRFNHQWEASGIPTRWEPALAQVAV